MYIYNYTYIVNYVAPYTAWRSSYQLEILTFKYNLNQNTISVKKSCGQESKKGHAEKMWNQNGQPRPSAVDGIIIFDNDYQASKHYCCLPSTSNSWQDVLQPAHHYHFFNSINSRRPLLDILMSHLVNMAFFRFLTRGVLVKISFLFIPSFSFLAKILL